MTNEERIIDMLTAVLERQTSLEAKWDAVHNVLLEVMRDSTKQGWDIQKMKATLYGAEGEGGGVVDQVRELQAGINSLKTFGIALPRWASVVASIVVSVILLASLCVIALTLSAIRSAFPGAIAWP